MTILGTLVTLGCRWGKNLIEGKWFKPIFPIFCRSSKGYFSILYIGYSTASLIWISGQERPHPAVDSNTSYRNNQDNYKRYHNKDQFILVFLWMPCHLWDLALDYIACGFPLKLFYIRKQHVLDCASVHLLRHDRNELFSYFTTYAAFVVW